MKATPTLTPATTAEQRQAQFDKIAYFEIDIRKYGWTIAALEKESTCLSAKPRQGKDENQRTAGDGQAYQQRIFR